MKVQNYKLEGLQTALKQMQSSQELGSMTVYIMAKMLTKIENAMKPFLETRAIISKKYMVKEKDEVTGKDKSIIGDQAAFLEEYEKVAMAETDVDLPESFELRVPAGSKVLTIILMKSFTDVFGDDNFSVVEV